MEERKRRTLRQILTSPWRGASEQRSVQDSDFGNLEFDGRIWRGRIGAGNIPITFQAGPRGLDASQREVGLHAIQNLAQMEAAARQYLATFDQPVLEVSAVQILRPAKEWVRNTFGTEHPEAAAAVLGGAPVVIFEFEIPDDRNVVYVVFFHGLPVGWDYH